MSTQVLLPKLGFSMKEGTIAEWLVEDGATVTEGQAIYTLESDKSVQEIESPSTGRIRILRPAQELCQVGEVLAEIE
jgi:pyruvate/2-oxoglutarate dehydrogenase complex dihydrolipoamide acyltransferase (E2) component